MAGLTCPVCKAQLEQGPQCRRCRADLSLLFDLQEQRQRILTEANLAVAAGRGEEVAILAERADALQRDSESQRLRALGCVLQRDFASAWRAYRSIKASSGD